MAIQVRCPSCGLVVVDAPDDAPGKMARCPKCQVEFRIVAPEPGVDMAQEPGDSPAEQAPPPVLVQPEKQPPRPQALQTRMSRMAIASLVMGLLSFILYIITGLPAVILGMVSFRAIKRSTGTLRGREMAVAGVCLGLLSLLCFISAICPLLPSRWGANEFTVLDSLKTIATQEAFFRQRCEVDQDGNRSGEYGLLAELAGEIFVRHPATVKKERKVKIQYLSEQFRTGGSAGPGYATKSGYHYRLYLCNAVDPKTHAATSAGDDKDLGGTNTAGGKPLDPRQPAQAGAISMQEKCFAVYAWPVVYTRTGTPAFAEGTGWATGRRAFFVNENGKVYATKMLAKTYDGEKSMPAANAAYVGEVFTSKISSGRKVGNDGNQWNPAW